MAVNRIYWCIIEKVSYILRAPWSNCLCNMYSSCVRNAQSDHKHAHGFLFFCWLAACLFFFPPLSFFLARVVYFWTDARPQRALPELAETDGSLVFPPCPLLQANLNFPCWTDGVITQFRLERKEALLYCCFCACDPNQWYLSKWQRTSELQGLFHVSCRLWSRGIVEFYFLIVVLRVQCWLLF